MNANLAGVRAARTTGSDEVAAALYEAAKDGTDRLRFVVAECVGNFVQVTRQAPDQAYIVIVRSGCLRRS